MDPQSSGWGAVAASTVSYSVPALPAVPPGLGPGLLFRAVAHFSPFFFLTRHLTGFFSNYIKENINLIGSFILIS